MCRFIVSTQGSASSDSASGQIGVAFKAPDCATTLRRYAEPFKRDPLKLSLSSGLLVNFSTADRRPSYWTPGSGRSHLGATLENY